MQNHYNLLYREEEREMMAFCRSEGIGVIPWSPLARGRLTRHGRAKPQALPDPTSFGNGMYSRTEASDRKVVDRLGQVAEHRGLPYAQIALAWMLSKPFITAPIVGATKPHHLADALAALSVRLTADEISTLEELYEPHPSSALAETAGRHRIRLKDDVMDIKDRVVLVTGASTGIGLAASRLLAKNGAKLALNARSEDKLEQLSKELPGSAGLPGGHVGRICRPQNDR